jgi:adenosylcobinamide-GDP ribazoletransferase
VAVRFLTIVPVPGREASGPGALGRAAWWFPVVGLALGAALALLDQGLARLFPPLLAALLVVSAWKITTGGIHLDGLADCLDGLGAGGREQRLAVMRDARIGVFGAVGLIIALLGAVVSLAELPPGLRWRALVLAPVIGRLAPVLAGAWFAPATPGSGSGARFLGALPTAAGHAHAVLIAGLALWLLGAGGLVALAVVLAAVAAWLRFVAGRLGGLTGDALGSSVELAELGTLLALAALVRLGAP